MSQNESSNQSPIPRVCMLDIETLDTKPSAEILSLGAVDVYGTDTWYKEFDTKHGQYDRTASLDTKAWWKEQSIPMPEGNIPLEDGLKDFHDWYTIHGFTEVWCKGTDFDFVILADAYRNVIDEKGNSIGTPWKYSHVRDFRTLSKLFSHVPAPLPYRVHNALTDAICQAAHLKEILNVIIRGQIGYQSQRCSGCASSNDVWAANQVVQRKNNF